MGSFCFLLTSYPFGKYNVADKSIPSDLLYSITYLLTSIMLKNGFLKSVIFVRESVFKSLKK